jgi:hypothetical protein
MSASTWARGAVITPAVTISIGGRWQTSSTAREGLSVCSTILLQASRHLAGLARKDVDPRGGWSGHQWSIRLAESE